MAKREVEERFVFDNGIEISAGTRSSMFVLTPSLLLEIGRLLREDYKKGHAICEELAGMCEDGCPLWNTQTDCPSRECLDHEQPMPAAHWELFILGYREGRRAGSVEEEE